MGKSATTSCFKIITCSADPTDNNEDLASQPESKTSSDKRRWSFRKRSVRHQVPSTTVISGPQSVNYDKENSEVTSNNFYTEKDLCIPEKIPKVEWMNETPPLPSAVISSEVTNSLVEDKTAATFDSNTQEVVLVIQTAATFDSNIQESDVLVIQTAIRRYLAQRELCKLKNVVKLQAAVRGHLVRREAVGTLRCVQAIVKMQALVRAHHARQTVKRFLAQEKLPEKSQINLQWSTVLVKRDSDMKANTTNSSTEKLLSNGFARQLLESIPKTKPIRISCDPSKPDSAWKWLERWMAVTSSKIEQTQELSLNHIHLEVEENNNLAACKEDVAPTIDVPLSSNRDLLPTEVTFKTASEDDFVTDTAGKIEFQDLETVADSLQNEDHNQFQGAALSMKQEHFGEGRAEEISDSVSCQLPFLSDETSHSIDYKNSNEPESVPEILISTSKREACQSIESEGKKSEPGMRKVRNPAFAAVQAKFEELSSAPKVSKSASSVESILVHAQVESLPKTEEHSLTESSATKTSVVQVAASECGTEISISSTLDSPERSEADGGEIVLEIGTSKEGNCDVNKCEDDVSNPERAIAGTKNSCSDFMTFQQQGLDENDGDATNVIRSANSVLGEQQPTKEPTSDIQIQPENMNDCRSPEASPRSHMTVPDSHGTPSSQISVHTNTSKTEKHSTTSKTVNNITGKKQRYKVVAKSSPPSLKNDSGERHNSDHLPKDVKNAKMRNSFGMAKHSHLDHEPRINSGNSLPSYMQATESARAKVHGTISLKSSPDVQDKDNYTKKRHSLPIGDDNQSSSPRVQRSASQTQQKSKGNSNHSPQTSVERRWQR